MEDSVEELSTLPEDVLFHICSFLKPRDLLALSATCHRMRSVLNTDCLWRQFTAGGFLGQGLDEIKSVVPPVYISPDNPDNSLEPLCQQRTHFLKQSRLLTNLRLGKYIKHSVPFEDSLGDLETSHLSCRQITYKDLFLFAIGYSDTQFDSLDLKVYNIGNAPKLIQSLQLNEHVIFPDYNVVVWLQVTGDFLIICQDSWIDVFKLKIVSCQEDCNETTRPIDSFPNVEVHLQDTINIGKHNLQFYSSLIVLQDLLICQTKSNVRVRDLKRSLWLNDILPKVDGDESLNEFNCFNSKEQKSLLFAVSTSKRAKLFSKLFLFDLTSMQYLDFSITLLEQVDLKYLICLFDANHVVVIDKKSNSIFVSVYNINKSSLLVKKILNVAPRNIEYDEQLLIDKSQIINQYLIVPSPFKIKILSLKNLDVVMDLHFDCGGLIPEIPQFFFNDMKCINMLGVQHLIVTRNTNFNVQLWDFKSLQNIFQSCPCSYINFNDTFSKLITVDTNSLNVLSFW